MAMSEELKAATERLMAWYAHTLTDRSHVYYQDGGKKLMGSDLHEVSRAYLADTDPTPLDEEYLRSVGFVKDDHPQKWTFHRDDALDVGLWLVDDGWKAMLLITPHWASCIRRGLKTRGDLILLCRALGIAIPTERKE